MTERLSLENVVPSMKWGFLADNMILLLKAHEGGQPLTEGEKHVVQGAIEFLKAVLEGLENLGQSRFEQGGIGRIVESLTLYSFASQALPAMALEDKARFKQSVGNFIQLCEHWYSGETVRPTKDIKDFFSAISRITLKETNSVLAVSRDIEPRWEFSRTLPTSS